MAIAHVGSGKLPEAKEINMKNAAQDLNLNDLATAFISFGMVVGLLLR